jgi:hypothetical protein
VASQHIFAHAAKYWIGLISKLAAIAAGSLLSWSTITITFLDESEFEQENDRKPMQSLMKTNVSHFVKVHDPRG